MKQNNNLFRQQVYFQKKEEIDALKADFEESGNGNKSASFHDLILLGLKAKSKTKDNAASKRTYCILFRESRVASMMYRAGSRQWTT